MKKVSINLSFVFIFATLLNLNLAKAEIIIVPPGNGEVYSLPELPNTTVLRHQDEPGFSVDREMYFQNRLKGIVRKIETKYNSDVFSLKPVILETAKLYNIDPIHILAAIVGEHAFNVDLKDDVQTYTIRLEMWRRSLGEEHPFKAVLECPEIQNVCSTKANDYEKWECFQNVWDNKFRNKYACGQNWGSKSVMMTFFNPLTGGKSFGLGQLGPIKIMSLSDQVEATSGFKRIDINNVQDAYEASLIPKYTIHYIAAATVNAINIYKQYTGFDISNNPGLTATLYNLGRERSKAIALNNINIKRVKAGLPLQLPKVNYYGYLINKNETLLRSYLGQ